MTFSADLVISPEIVRARMVMLLPEPNVDGLPNLVQQCLVPLLRPEKERAMIADVLLRAGLRSS
jgi:hypothetical protein